MIQAEVTQDEIEAPLVGVVEVVGVQGEHVVEFCIEGEVVGEMEVEGMEAEETGSVFVLALVEGEAVLALVERETAEEEAERHWRGLLEDRQCRVVLRTPFWRLPRRYFSSFSDW